MSNVAANSAAGSVKVCMFLKRKNGTSHDEFNQYWSEKHAPLIQEWLPKHGISRDTQASQLGKPSCDPSKIVERGKLKLTSSCSITPHRHFNNNTPQRSLACKA